MSLTENLGNFEPGDSDFSIEYIEINRDIIQTINRSTQTFTLVALDFSFLNTSLVTEITMGERMDGARNANPSLCSITIFDTINLCDSAMVIHNTMTTVVTNRRITYRSNTN